jgi:hypothetical protein
MLSPGTKKRISRINRRAVPEVAQAYRQGRISARRADTLLYLPLEEQRRELDRILAEQEKTSQRSKIAAAILRDYVARGCGNLHALQQDLKTALAHA